MTSAYQKLVRHFKKIHNLSHLGAICGWDQAAMMPSGGNQARSEAMAELAVLIHQQFTQPQLADWFAEAERQLASKQHPGSAQQAAALHEMRRAWQRATALPESLVEAKSLAGSRCEHAWRRQRKDNDWGGFEKNFTEVVRLSQEEAQIRASQSGLRPYDAMLALYEPGMHCERLDSLFADLKSWLPDLVREISDKQAAEPVQIPSGPFDVTRQQQLGLKVMEWLQFDFNHGRLDVSIHPFCGGIPEDVRITTRYNEQDFTHSLMGIIHETGHARYEQGLPKEWAGQPAGEARSMGIHESQSLLFEMQLARSPEFLKQLTPLAAEMLERKSDPAFSVDNLRAFYTRVRPGYIRVDADEVTYPAHIILRYEIERDLIEGRIGAADIPELWDQKMQQYLGLSTKDNFRDGCMQDIHWTDGSFGYFPSYTLGAMYAAQFFAAAEKQLPGLREQIASGELTPLFNWLKERIWSQGSLLETDALVSQATGCPLDPAFFRAHLERRYR